MEENGGSVGKTMELIGTSWVEGLGKLRTLRTVESSIHAETQVDLVGSALEMPPFPNGLLFYSLILCLT